MSTVLPPSLWPLLQRLTTGDAWPPPTPAAADALVGEANRHGVLGLLFCADALPDALAAALDRARAWRRLLEARSEALDRLLAGVAGALDDEPWVALKGADYRHRLYPSPWLRPMQDVDVLVPYDRAADVGRRLVEAGFAPSFPGGAATRVPSHHERVYSSADGVVEVHHAFVQRARHRIDYDAVWARRRPLETPAWRGSRLDDVDALLAHAVGLAVDGFVVPLARYVDLWLLLRQAPDTLAVATRRAREWQVRHALYGAARTLARLFPEAGRETAPIEVLLGRPARALLDRFVLPAPLGRRRERDLGRLARLWRKFWLIDNLARRASFVLYHGRAWLAGRRLARGDRATE
jgi:hypothetical protein